MSNCDNLKSPTDKHICRQQTARANKEKEKNRGEWTKEKGDAMKKTNTEILEAKKEKENEAIRKEKKLPETDDITPEMRKDYMAAKKKEKDDARRYQENAKFAEKHPFQPTTNPNYTKPDDKRICMETEAKNISRYGDAQPLHCKYDDKGNLKNEESVGAGSGGKRRRKSRKKKRRRKVKKSAKKRKTKAKRRRSKRRRTKRRRRR